jgi:hypothetical protein
MRKFRVHFNRQNMQRGNRNVWTAHTSQGCYQAEHIKILVPVETVYKENGRQPRAYFTGYGHVKIEGKTIIIF